MVLFYSLFNLQKRVPKFVGWFARDPRILRQVGRILLQLPYMDARQPRQFLIADDCFKLSLIPTERTVDTLRRSIQKVFRGEVLGFITRSKVERIAYKLVMAADDMLLRSCIYRWKYKIKSGNKMLQGFLQFKTEHSSVLF